MNFKSEVQKQKCRSRSAEVENRQFEPGALRGDACFRYNCLCTSQVMACGLATKFNAVFANGACKVLFLTVALGH